MNRLQEKFEKAMKGKTIINYYEEYSDWLETYHTNKVDEIFTGVEKSMNDSVDKMCSNCAGKCESACWHMEIWLKYREAISTLKSKLKD